VETPMDFRTYPIEDLFLVPSEDLSDEKGEPIYCLFNRKIDALTFIGVEDRDVLRERGIQTLPNLP
jgi:hypothetical protein